MCKETRKTWVLKQRNKTLKWLFKQCNKIHFKTIVSNSEYDASNSTNFFANTEIRSRNNLSYISQRYILHTLHADCYLTIHSVQQKRATHKHKEFVCCYPLAAWRHSFGYTFFLLFYAYEFILCVNVMCSLIRWQMNEYPLKLIWLCTTLNFNLNLRHSVEWKLPSLECFFHCCCSMTIVSHATVCVCRMLFVCMCTCK